MSKPFFQNVTVPADELATPGSIGAAVVIALHDLHDRVVLAGRRPVWDTIAITTDVDEVDDSTLDGAEGVINHRTIRFEILTIDPKEVQ